MTTIVIGAGIAGLSAGYHLTQAGREVILLEARDRIGGRVWTNRDFADIPVEFGAELIHGAKISTWEWVEKLGLKTVHWQKTDDSMVRLEDGRWMTMREARETSPEFDITRSWILQDIDEPMSEEDLGTYLKRIGFTDEQLRYVQRSYANAEGEAMDKLNAAAHATVLQSSEDGDFSDHRILDGYDSYYNALADGLDIRLNTVVTEIDWSDDVTVKTADGQTFTGDNAVITVTVGVLKANAIQFTPELPQVKHEALAGIDMGPVMKMVYEFEEPILDRSIGAIYAKDSPPMWWSPSLRRDEDTIVWTAFFSGNYAREMLELGEEKALQKGLETLREEVGNPELTYKQARWVNWPQDEFSRGGYSYCLPGHLDARDKLAQPTPPLYWAGEGAAPLDQVAVVHGAYFTGQRAANEIINGGEL